MTTGHHKTPKRVSFNENVLVSVHHIDPLGADQIQELFYHNEDYEQFRYERSLEIALSARNKQARSTFVRATRRSSIDLMEASSSGPQSSVVHLVPRLQIQVSGGSRKKLPRHSGHSSASWQKSTVTRIPSKAPSTFQGGAALAA